MGKAIAPISFGLGLIIGACTVMMYGSESGRLTREQFREKFRNKLANKYDGRINDLNEKIMDVQRLADDLRKKTS